MKIRDLILLLNTLRYIPLKQIYHRIYFLFRRHYWELIKKKVPSAIPPPIKDLSPFYSGLNDVTKPGPWSEEVRQTRERAERVSHGCFDFLNIRKEYKPEPAWDDRSTSQLFRYQLHYFSYAIDMLLWQEITATQEAWDAFKFLSTSWIRRNKLLTGDGWHPYTISLRIVNWLNIYYHWRAYFRNDEGFEREFTSSIWGQAKILAASLECDVRGNHLLKNLKALIWAGSVFEGMPADSWFDDAVSLLKVELDEQILPDGCHFERTPGYHALVLMDCIEIGLLFKRYRQTTPPEWLDGAIKKMLSYLRQILPPDGQLPLLKDTTWGQEPLAQDVLAAGACYLQCPQFKTSNRWGLYPHLLFGLSGWKMVFKWPVSEQTVDCPEQPSSGYYVVSDTAREDYLIVDAGQVCPDYLPAHAHADMLNYELVIKGRRIIVDSGVYEYQSGPWRDYFRSTRAHNTVEINRENQSEVWSSFRVARRAKPFNVSIKTEKNHVLFEASHDGYARLPVSALHRRILACQKGEFWLVVDEIRGQGSVAATSYIHLHPGIEVIQMDSHRWRLEGMPLSIYIMAFGIGGTDIICGQTTPFLQGWYSEQFGMRSPNAVIALHKNESMPLVFGYLVTAEKFIDIETGAYGDSGTEIRIKSSDRIYNLCVGHNEVGYAS